MATLNWPHSTHFIMSYIIWGQTRKHILIKTGDRIPLGRHIVHPKFNARMREGWLVGGGGWGRWRRRRRRWRWRKKRRQWRRRRDEINLGNKESRKLR